MLLVWWQAWISNCRLVAIGQRLSANSLGAVTGPSKVKVELWLPGYLGKNKNPLYGRHWSVVYRERRRAAKALLSALLNAQQELAITPDLSEPTKLCLINSCAALLSLMMIARRSGNRTTSRSRSARSKKKEPTLELNFEND
jgi:hypothetical protein